MFDEPVRRRRGRILRPRERRADAHVDDLGAVAARPLHRVDHHFGCRRADAAEHAICEECHAGRDARDAAVRADDARDVRAVARTIVRERIGLDDWRRVVGVELVADEVEPSLNAAARPETTTEIRMIVVDARVDDGDTDAATRKPELALRDVGAGLFQRGDQIDIVAGLILLRAEAHVQDGIDGQHAGDRSELCAVARCRADGDAVPEIFEAPAVGIPNTASPRRRMEVGFLAIEHGRRRALNAWRTGQLDEPPVPRLVVAERNDLRRLRVRHHRRADDEPSDTGEKLPHGLPPGCES